MASRSRTRSASFALICFAFGLLLAEGTVRSFSLIGGAIGRDLAKRDPRAVRVTPHGEYGYRQRANYFNPYPNGTRANWNSMSYRGPEVDLVKPDCGAVFPSGDAGALAAALERCYGDSEAMGQAAAETIRRWSFDEDIGGLKQAISALEGET